jgi:hypothetical protein
MKSGTRDEAEGKLHQAKGKIKEIAGYTMGGFIHALLVITLIVVLIRVFQERRPV